MCFIENTQLFRYKFAKYHLCSYGHLSLNINKQVDFGGALAEKRNKIILDFLFLIATMADNRFSGPDGDSRNLTRRFG